MLNQAATDRIELAKLLNISDLQLSYITNVDAGHGLIKVGSNLVPFANKFPKNTKLYKLMSTRPGEGLDQMKEEAAAGNNSPADMEAKMNVADSKPASGKMLTAREKAILNKIKEVAKSQEEYDALVKKYLGK